MAHAPHPRPLDLALPFEAHIRLEPALLRRVFDVNPDGVLVIDDDGVVAAANPAAVALTGYPHERLVGLRVDELVQIEARQRHRDLRMDAQRERVERPMSASTTLTLARADGVLVPVEIASSLTEVEGEPVVLSISRDIRERQREVRRLQELTLHDELTGLFNRRGLDVMLPQQAKRAKRSGRPVVVMYGDIDEFKRLNDTYGHERGDAVLVAVAMALRAAFRETDLVARLGGDEFCVVAEDISAAHLAQRVDDAMEAAGREVGIAVRMSHGEVVSGWPGLEEPAELLGRADARMYQAKQARRRS